MWVEFAERVIEEQRLRADRDSCENLQSLSDLGFSPRFSLLYVRGAAFDPAEGLRVSEATDSRTLYRMRAHGRLSWLKGLRSERPEMAEEFGAVLAKAEQAWQGCIAG